MYDPTCRRNCWLLAAACGVGLALAFIYLWNYAPLPAAVLGLIVFLVLGVMFAWTFCSGSAQAAPAPQPMPRTAPEPVPAAAPAPEPAAAAEPAPAAAGHSMEWQVTDASAGQRHAIFGGTAQLPPRDEADEAAAEDEPVAEAEPPKPVAKSKPKAESPAPAAGIDAAMDRSKEDAGPEAEPLLLLAPRDGKADDLKLIVGIGPALEKLLNEVGVWHFDQIASWKAKDIAFVDARLKTFKGRITRDEWVKQARALSRSGTA